MFDALYIGATGMQAQQLNVDTIANNLANVNTTGFKRSRVSFTDLVARDSSRLGTQATDAGLFGPGPGASLGAGVGILNLSKLFDMGDLKKTDSALDVTVRGDGFIEVAMPDGSTAYTRGGTLKVTKDGQLATLSGLPLKANIAIPDDAQEILIHPEGLVQVRTSAKSSPMDVGRIDLVRFANAPGLVALGDNLYRPGPSSGEPLVQRPGDEGTGTFAQGFLEGSNVKMVEEMVNLMVAQRTYEANVKIVQAADEILGMVNGLRR